jgi:DNA-binding response OmpR family regulator
MPVEAIRKPIFVVDRDPHVQRLIQQFLRDTHEVEVFDDGYVALDRARRIPPAAVLTEILVSKLDGLALCRLLKGDDATKHVPVMVVSIIEAAGRAHESGADGFYAKPLEKGRFLASFRAMFEFTPEASAP